MKDINFFTVDDVREINQNRINKQSTDFSKLTSTSKIFIRETRFTTKEINKAFAAAKKSLETS